MSKPTSQEALLERLAILDQQIEDLQARLVALQQLQGSRPIDDVKQTLAVLLRSRAVLREWLTDLDRSLQDRSRAATGSRRLHIADSLRIIAKHTRISSLSITQARVIIQELAAAQAHTRNEGRLIQELQERTGLSIADLATLSREWLQTG